MADGSTFDINEMLRKAKLAYDLQQQQDQPQVAGSPLATQGQYQPPQQSQSQYTPQMMTPPQMPSIPSTVPFESAATAYQNIGQAPRAQDFPRNKLLTALVAPLEFKNLLRNPRQTMENIDLLTRKGYGSAQQKYEQDAAQAKQNFGIQKEVLDQRLKVLTDDLRASRETADTHMAIGKYNQWVQNLPAEQQYEAAKLAEMQARVKEAGAPVLSRSPEMVVYKKPDGTVVTTEGFIQAYKDPNKMPEFILPGEDKPIPNKDIIRFSKPVSASSNPVIRQIEAERQMVRDKEGREPTPAEDEQFVKNARLLAQNAISDREQVQNAVKTVGTRINKDYVSPTDKRLVDLRAVSTTLRSAMGKGPDEKKNAVAAVASILEEVKSIVGSGRVAVSEYPLIKDAPGKPPSVAAYIKNLLGLGSPIPDATLNDLANLVDTQLKDVQALNDIALRWSYKNLDAKTEADAVAAGKSFDEELKTFQNPQPQETEEERLSKELIRRGQIPK